MSRYLILLILTAPFIVGGLINTLVNYKLKRIPKRKFWLQAVLWLLIFAGLGLAEPLYVFLFSHNLTQTEPLSLFDVIQITGIMLVFFMVNRYRGKVDALERRVQDLHQELSIRLSEETRKPSN